MVLTKIDERYFFGNEIISMGWCPLVPGLGGLRTRRRMSPDYDLDKMRVFVTFSVKFVEVIIKTYQERKTHLIFITVKDGV